MSYATTERALNDYRAGIAGFYVVNSCTNLAVAGPFIANGPATPPAAPDPLIVVSVS